MPVAFNNLKHDIQLNDVPYRIRNYQRSELSAFIPRFGAGEQAESQFDLLRSASIKGFAGGELQRYWKDDTSAFGIEGLENKYDDGTLYPSTSLETVTGDIYGTVKPRMTAWCRTSDYLFVASTTYNTPTTQIRRVNNDGTGVNLTLPTALQNNTVSSMVLKGSRLWIFCAYYASAIFYVDLTSTTVNSVTGGVGFLSLTVVYRGEIYGTNSSYANTNLYRYTGDTTTRSFELVATTDKQSDPTANLFVYNNRIILSRKDGLYGYDGILMNTIEDMTSSESPFNYRSPAVLKGYLYYFMPDGMYRFNGSLIEKLYDVSESGHPSSVCYGDNKLWYVYRNSEYAGSTRYDKSMGYDYEVGDLTQGRVAYFDGKGMYTYSRLANTDKSSVTDDFSGQGEPDGIIYHSGKIYVTTHYSKFDFNLHRTAVTQPSTRFVQIVSSIFDGDFPQIQKQLEETEITFDGLTDISSAITIEARTETTVGGFEGDGGWVQVGNCVVNGDKIMPVYNQTIGQLRFKKIQFRITGNLSPETGIEKFIIRYTLQPEYKGQWTFTALCYGDDEYGKLQLQDKTEDTQSVAKLRGNIYASRESDYPVPFLDIDSITLNADLSSGATTATIVSGQADILKSDVGFLQIGTEVVHYTRVNATTLTIARGQLGTTASSHLTGAKMYPYYRVFVRQIQNERMELYDEELTTGSMRSRDSEITIVLQEV